MGDTKLFDVDELDPRFKDTEFFVEANDNEVIQFWSEFAKQSTLYPTEKNRYDWKQDCLGRTYTVAWCNLDGKDYPVNITFFWYTIDGVLVAFWDTPSLVVHYGLIEKWWKKHLLDINKHYDKCNSLNFHHCLDYIDKKNKKY